MSLWLQEEIKKLEDYRKKCTPTSKHIKITALVLIIIEIALFVLNQFTPNYNTLPLCGVVGFMGLLLIMIFTAKSKTLPNRPKLPFATKCIEEFQFSSEELQQFDSEMMATPLALIKNNNRSDIPIIITEHYMAYTTLHLGEIDYGIFRLSEIAMTCYASSRSHATASPLDKVFDIDLLNIKGEKIGGLTIDSKKNFMEFNAALEKYAPNIQLNVPIKEVKNIRKNS